MRDTNEPRAAATSSARLPTLAEARERKLVAEKSGWFGDTNLLESDPRSERHALALVVRALVHTRRHHDREDELGTGLVERLIAAASQVPARRLRGSSWQCVVAVHDRVARRCDACSYRPGTQICQGCGGGGSIRRGNDERDRMPCSGCRTTGTVTCARCDGGLAIQRVTVRTFEDHVAELEHVFLPPIPIAMTAAISEHLLAIDELPAELAVDVDRPATVPLGSYRASAGFTPPRFHGIDAVHVLPEAKSTLSRLATQGTLVERVVQAHAVPMLLLDYPGHTVGIASVGETLTAFVAENDGS
ncbi:MAG: hypothetical protein J0L92_06070 [Deltaproteobacteria bacterium]|nr:hypothetical protein [Deltaproteobacteria bacterium]